MWKLLRCALAVFVALGVAVGCAGERPTLSESVAEASGVVPEGLAVPTTISDAPVVPLTTIAPDEVPITTTTTVPVAPTATAPPRQAAELGALEVKAGDVDGQVDVIIGGVARCGVVEFTGIEPIGSLVDLQVVTSGGAPCEETVFLQLLQVTPAPGTYDIFVNGTLAAAQFDVG